MAYAILRTAKLKSFGEIAGSLSHTHRTRETLNADPQRNHLNEHHGPGDPDEIRETIRAHLPDKRRSDAVLCIEYFVGASPEFFTDDQDGTAYFAAAVEWLERRHGVENVVAWSIHRDETSPHLIAYVIPLDASGKINAKSFLGGKAKLSDMQTDFAATTGAPFGLLRGIEGSQAEHSTIRSYYAALKQGEVKPLQIRPEALTPRIVERGLLRDTRETPEQTANRLTRAMRKHYGPAVKQAALANLERKRAVEMAATARAKAEEVNRLRRLLEREQEELRKLRALYLDGLTPTQSNELADLAAFMQEMNAPKAQAITAQQTPRRDKGARKAPWPNPADQSAPHI